MYWNCFKKDENHNIKNTSGVFQTSRDIFISVIRSFYFGTFGTFCLILCSRSSDYLQQQSWLQPPQHEVKSIYMMRSQQSIFLSQHPQPHPLPPQQQRSNRVQMSIPPPQHPQPFWLNIVFLLLVGISDMVPDRMRQAFGARVRRAPAAPIFYHRCTVTFFCLRISYFIVFLCPQECYTCLTNFFR